MASFVRGGGTGSCTKGPRTGKKSTGRRKYSTWNTWETHRKQTFFFGWIWRWGQSLNSTSSPPVWSSWTISRSFTPPQGSSAIDQKKNGRLAELYIQHPQNWTCESYIFFAVPKILWGFHHFHLWRMQAFTNCWQSPSWIYHFFVRKCCQNKFMHVCMSWFSLPNFISERRWLVEKSWKTPFQFHWQSDFDLEVAALGNRGSHKDFGLTFEPAKGLHQTLKLICI